MTDEVRPARGYRWEDAKPGNTIALKHGAWSPRIVEAAAQVLVDGVLQTPQTAYLADPSYRPALWGWAVAETRAERYGSALVEHGECAGCKRCAAWDASLQRWEASARAHRQRLGLDPLSRARLGRDVVATRLDLAQAWAAEVEGGDPDAA